MEFVQFEGHLESTELVESHAEGPNVGGSVVTLLVDKLGRHVNRCPAVGLRQPASLIEPFGNPKVADFDDSILANHDIISLQIPMQNFTIMHVFHSQKDLREPVNYFALFEKLKRLFLALRGHKPVVDDLVKILAISKLHDDVLQATLSRVRLSQ